ncbi:hypothetical protein G9U51_06350 [Calidifontibacter sp. DB0510]|uniref:DUF4913 domain-containing protein n=1 Tax=Metallococcus carri TaxID=1656884 RepID=A0A967AZT9_9MICO|nr:hypothetical protein [Metallococcus carri]NHN55404.1 hypothetical protein [Metallococcus carri]NOP36481.1 hypothetical protein [Calidifontibacter sp. DB2511S]
MTEHTATAPEPDDAPEPPTDIDAETEDAAEESNESGQGEELPEPPHPVNWNLLTADEAKVEWRELNKWVNWLRRTYGLPASVLPPFWHRHAELVWELSALHLHWLCAYDPEENGSAPLGWHRDFAEARGRLREWVAASGTRLDRDRPTRQTAWPGEKPAPSVEDIVIPHRDADFAQFTGEDITARRQAEDEFYAGLNPDTGELP